MKSTKIFVIVLILLIIIAGGLFALKILGTMQNAETANTSADANLANQGNEQDLSTPKTLSGAERTYYNLKKAGKIKKTTKL